MNSTIGKAIPISTPTARNAAEARAKLDSMQPKLVKAQPQQQPQPKKEQRLSPEADYIRGLIDTQAPVFVALQTGEDIACRIIWCDRYSVLISDSADNQELLIWKHSIRSLRPAENQIWMKGGDNDDGK